MPRGRVTAGVRSIGDRDSVPEPEAAPVPTRRQSNEVMFRSRSASYRLGLTKRIVRFTADGERFEDPRVSKLGTPLDEVKFEDHTFRTTDPELVALITKASGYGVGQQFWDVADQEAAHTAAREAEIRRVFEENPEIVKKVLKASEKEDFVLPPAE